MQTQPDPFFALLASIWIMIICVYMIVWMIAGQKGTKWLSKKLGQTLMRFLRGLGRTTRRLVRWLFRL